MACGMSGGKKLAPFDRANSLRVSFRAASRAFGTRVFRESRFQRAWRARCRISAKHLQKQSQQHSHLPSQTACALAALLTFAAAWTGTQSSLVDTANSWLSMRSWSRARQPTVAAATASAGEVPTKTGAPDRTAAAAAAAEIFGATRPMKLRRGSNGTKAVDIWGAVISMDS